MLINLQEILTKYNLAPKGVIQIGAHWAEEHEEFVKCGIERFVYIEPCKEAFFTIDNKLGATYNKAFVPSILAGGGCVNICYPNISIFLCACGSEEKEMPMYVSHQNQGQSNSLLKPNLHLEQHPEVVFDDAEVVKVVTLDSLPIEKEKYSLLILDCQGYEGEVFLGANETLKHMDLIITEVNRGQTYALNKEIEWVDEYLGNIGFERVETFWPSPNLTWGDAVYCRL